MTRWTADRIPDLTGRVAVVTGANSGLGFHTVFELARHGAHVTMAVRDQVKGQAALGRLQTALRQHSGAGEVSIAPLDLADLSSISAFADSRNRAPLDLLVNNAGVMAIPRRLTADGFEMQLGTNHLGHMALTLRLLPELASAGSRGHASRVVTVSSAVHRRGQINFDDLMGEQNYKPWGAYAQSKLANLLFTSELERRMEAAGLPVAAYAAHPGYADTNLQAVGPQMSGSAVSARMAAFGNRLFAQPAERGALPTLYAATVPGLPPGSYVGPDGLFEQRGCPKVVGRSAAASDQAVAERLWQVSEDLLGLHLVDVVAGLD